MSLWCLELTWIGLITLDFYSTHMNTKVIIETDHVCAKNRPQLIDR